jgi:hypothetical protein
VTFISSRLLNLDCASGTGASYSYNVRNVIVAERVDKSPYADRR